MIDHHILIGQRVREYRKRQHFTLDELAKKIHKSKSSLSKYEQGTVAIDLDTLIAIAGVLNVSVHRLIDIPEDIEHSAAYGHMPIWMPNTLYIYINSFSAGQIYSGVVELHEDYTASFYLNPTSENSYRSAALIYQGRVYVNPSISQLVLFNETNVEDTLLISFNTILYSQNYFIGQCICATLPPQPVCSKCIVSKIKLDKDTAAQYLSVTPNEIRTLRKSGIFCIDPELQYNYDELKVK